MKLKNKGISFFVLYLMGGILLTSIESVGADEPVVTKKSGLKVHKIKGSYVENKE